MRKYIQENNIDAEYMEFEKSCHSVKQAAEAANADKSEFVKNICLISEDKLVVAIVKGEDKVDLGKVADFIHKPVRIAKPKEILEKSGYPVGGVPSFGYQALFLIDPKVMKQNIVYSGGGSSQSLVKISPQELLRANHGSVTEVRVS